MLLSRQIIRNIVIPVVERILVQNRHYSGYRYSVVRDPHLEGFLEEAMRRHFGVIGANGCQHLKEQLEEAMRNDPYAFELLVRRLLEKYSKLVTKLRSAKKLRARSSDTYVKNRKNQTKKQAQT